MLKKTDRKRETHQIRELFAKLTVNKFKQYLENRLRGLPLTEEIVRPLLDVLDSFPEPVAISLNVRPADKDSCYQSKKPVTMFRVPGETSPAERIMDFLEGAPKNPQFWQVLRMAEKVEQESCGHLGRADQVAMDYFRRNFAQHYGKPPPAGWQEAAARVFLVLDMLRGGALLATKPGRPEELTEVERKNIAADCERWYPVCQELKESWDDPSYWKKEWEDREVILDKLAKRHAISAKEIGNAELLLGKKRVGHPGGRR